MKKIKKQSIYKKIFIITIMAFVCTAIITAIYFTKASRRNDFNTYQNFGEHNINTIIKTKSYELNNDKVKDYSYSKVSGDLDTSMFGGVGSLDTKGASNINLIVKKPNNNYQTMTINIKDLTLHPTDKKHPQVRLIQSTIQTKTKELKYAYPKNIFNNQKVWKMAPYSEYSHKYIIYLPQNIINKLNL